MSDDIIPIKYPRAATIFASICAILFCIVGFLGNFVTILALARCPKLISQATTAFVLSLCISDLIFCSVSLPLIASRYISEKWVLGKTSCKLFPVLLYGNVALSLLNMVAITINRYTIISYYPYYNKLYSKLSILLQLLFIWTVSFLIMLPPLLGIWGQLDLHPPTFSCTILEKDGKSPKKFIFLVGFALPCVVIIISYICIYLKVRSSTKNLRKHQTNDAARNKNSRREREDGRLTKLMLLIFICFVFCFLPLMCVNVFDDDVRYPTLHVFASILAWASSVINPFIYAASNRQYRTAYSKLFHVFRSSVTPSDSRQLSNSQKSRGTDNKNTHQLVKITTNE
ncbi:hypothetical protein Trydic_g14411 [Trypoxylus dichotomus]